MLGFHPAITSCQPANSPQNNRWLVISAGHLPRLSLPLFLEGYWEVMVPLVATVAQLDDQSLSLANCWHVCHQVVAPAVCLGTSVVKRWPTAQTISQVINIQPNRLKD